MIKWLNNDSILKVTMNPEWLRTNFCVLISSHVIFTSLHSNLAIIKCKFDLLLSYLEFFSEVLSYIKYKLGSLMAWPLWTFLPYLLPAPSRLVSRHQPTAVLSFEYIPCLFPTTLSVWNYPFCVPLLNYTKAQLSALVVTFSASEVFLAHWPPTTFRQFLFQLKLLSLC